MRDPSGAAAGDDGMSRSGGLPSSLAAMMKEMDDCDRPACEDTVSALTAALGRVKTKKESAVHVAPSAKSSGGGGGGGGGSAPPPACPPTSGLLGKSSWNLIHSMAAWYPDNPSREDERMMTQFMNAFARFYPCTYCATDFQNNLAKSPVKARSREDLCMWLCEQHNLVNEKLGKGLFNCDMKTLDERW
eukprot:CAMPEP_0181043842 /NCGR_PEP_ID=MMETSP1070-20121207/12932_1 /TAXON_ID=265543 /ORGANISM="Minutocellus polymorphus, Strain NH13" /LENGTH=188 /DNA_ID=CAMNT_0023122215 /DNA_START=161 /DNA_END=724 /DNA_ORIENTATION=-